MHPLRRKIEQSESLANFLAGGAARYLGWCDRTTRWDIQGKDQLIAALSDGPVIYLTWHSRSLLAGRHWPGDIAQLCSLHADSPIGRVGAAAFRRVGVKTWEMSTKRANTTASREVLKRAKSGDSVGVAPDGPLGPARVVGDATLEWARATGFPIFCYAFSTTRQKRADSWDKMLVPKARGRGAQVFKQFEHLVPKKMDAEAKELIRQQLTDCLNDTTARADRLIGLEPGP